MKCYEGLLINAALYQVWAKKAVQRFLEKAGMKVVPCDFYSSVPSRTEIENSFEYSSVHHLMLPAKFSGYPRPALIYWRLSLAIPANFSLPRRAARSRRLFFLEKQPI